MTVGRKPKPVQLKLVTGNPGKKPIPRELQATGAPRKPRYLKGRAAGLWRQYAPALIKLGVLKEVDATMFAAWCALAAEFEREPAAMSASRISQMRGLASSFGLDASARVRLGALAPGGGSDPATNPDFS